MSQMLLLNMGYQPLAAINRRKGLDLLYFRCKAEVIASYEATGEPAVIRLSVKIPDPNRWQRLRSTMKCRKDVVLKRDSYTCVYCGVKPADKKKLTIDHVIPRSKGGDSSYGNCVSACKKCNNWKGASTPEEAGMRMLYRSEFTAVGNTFFDVAPDEWLPFIQ
jgi:5-methylcytosine-specific restriction endonuclease McrA